MRMKSLSRRDFLKGLVGGAAFLFLPRAGLGQEALRIGLQADLTGTLPEYGYWHAKVLKAAIDKINAEGGIAHKLVELIIEDTATKPDIGRQKLLKMALNDGADFVIGSQHSGVSIACLPLAAELEIIYFPLGEATEITGKLGNRYIFRPNHSVRSHVQVSYKWAVNNLGKRWTIIVADYAFGQSHAQEWPPKIQEEGGEVIDIIYIPLGAEDFVPYLSKVDRERTEVLFHVFPGGNALRFLTQAQSLGLLKDVVVFGVICTIEGISLKDVPALEGSWYVSNHPRLAEDVPQNLQPFDQAFREAVGASPDGYELGSDRVTTGSHYWYTWETAHLIKLAVEETGWQSKAQNKELIKFLEGINLEAGFAFPQGDKFIRAEDHQTFHDHYLEQFEAGKLRVKERFAKEQAVYAPEVDYRQ